MSELEKKENTEPEGKSASLKQFFSHADSLDWLLIFIGTLSAIINGCSMPFFNILFGEMLDSINEPGQFMSTIEDLALVMVIVGLINILTGFMQVYCWTLTGERQSQKVREKYVQAILSQEIGWFDTCGANQLSTKVTEVMGKIEDGSGKKIAEFIQYLVQFVASLAVAFTFSWRITCVLISVVPLLSIAAFFMVNAISAAQTGALEQYAKAGGLATEVLSSIRTITSLNLQPEVIGRYRKYLYEALQIGIRKGFAVGMGHGTTICASFLSYSIGFWYAGTLVADGLRGNCQGPCLSGGDVLTTFFCTVMGSMALGQMAPSMVAFFTAKSAYVSVFETLDRVPLIDGLSDEGLQPTEKLTGKIEVRDIRFSYPSRPHIEVCKGYDLTINPGETVALVGASGCGKSTIINLILRFYDPTSGSINFDQYNIKDLNIKWLRSQIGYVGQEPILFSGTIAENIAFGLDPNLKPGSLIDNKENADNELLKKVKEAATLANAYDFISEFPSGFNTSLGSHGLSVSGGQKQRIAIARALIKKPPILLLDEATSALDSVSEKIVQKSIDQLASSKQQTTIIIAHRLSTIINADKICVIQDGKISEIGNHKELVAKGGLYADLIKLQMDSLHDEDEAEAETATEVTEAAAVQATISEPTSSHRSLKSSIKHSIKSTTQALSTKSSKEKKAAISEEEKKKVKELMMGYIFEYKLYVFMGVIGAAVLGAIFPIWGYLIANTQDMFFMTSASKLEARSQLYAGIYGLLAFVSLISCFFEYYGVIGIGENISCRLRSQMFESFLRQEISYFDYEENSVGSLTTRLSDDARTMNKAFGESLAKMIQAFFCLVIAIIMAFTASWEMSLILLGALPINIACSAIQISLIHGSNNEDASINYDDVIVPKNGKYTKAQLRMLKEREIVPRGGSGSVISTAFTNMRTISAFSIQHKVRDQYCQITKFMSKKKVKLAMLAGLGFGLSNGVIFFIYALLFWSGGKMITEGRFDFLDMMTAIMTLMFGALGLGAAVADLGDQASALESAARIFNTIEKSKDSKIDGLSSASLIPKEQLPKRTTGRIEFKDVSFTYPTRPEAQVCKGYNFTIEPGQTVALVGPSGSGKSTIIALLQRFYDPKAGQILLDGMDIKDINVRWLRSQIGYVGQEPVLFEGDILDNMIKGRSSNVDEPLIDLQLALEIARNEKKAAGGDVTTNYLHTWFNRFCRPPRTPVVKQKSDTIPEDVLEASIYANSHEFISGFTNGYHTDIGQKSMMVSGGQKQRIAIARALIKKPPILLLDEATSALDSGSEKIVQESIDKLSASKDQTTIIIAHRLTTIKNSDRIFVVDKGQIVEAGTHDELLAIPNGVYKNLWERQNASNH